MRILVERHIIHGTSVRSTYSTLQKLRVEALQSGNRALITYNISIFPSEKVHIPNDPEHLDPFAVEILPFQ